MAFDLSAEVRLHYVLAWSLPCCINRSERPPEKISDLSTAARSRLVRRVSTVEPEITADCVD